MELQSCASLATRDLVQTRTGSCSQHKVKPWRDHWQTLSLITVDVDPGFAPGVFLDRYSNGHIKYMDIKSTVLWRRVYLKHDS